MIDRLIGIIQHPFPRVRPPLPLKSPLTQNTPFQKKEEKKKTHRVLWTLAVADRMPVHHCHCPPVRNAQSLRYRGNTGGAHDDEEGSEANVFCSDRVHRRSFSGSDKRSTPRSPPCLPKADTRASQTISASQSVDIREGHSRRTEEEEGGSPCHRPATTTTTTVSVGQPDPTNVSPLTWSSRESETIDAKKSDPQARVLSRPIWARTDQANQGHPPRPGGGLED